MDHLSNNHSFLPVRPFPSRPFGDHSFPLSPSQPTGLSQYVSYVDEEATQRPDIVKNVQMLLEAGLDVGNIFKFRQTKYRNALHMLADAEDDELIRVCDSFTQPRPLPQRLRTRLSQQPYTDPRSRVPSLISDRSSLRLSGNLNTPVLEEMTSGPGFAGDVSPMSLQWPVQDDTFQAAAGCIPDATMVYLAGGEEHPKVYAPNPRYTGGVSPYSQLQQAEYGVPPAIPASIEVPFPASAVDGSIPPGGAERSLSPPDTLIPSPFIAEQEPLRDRSRMLKPRFPCSVEYCPKDFFSPKEFAKHLIGDHDKDSTFTCMHPHCSFQTHRLESWKRHHSNAHAQCQFNGNCIHVDRLRVKKHWACGLCLHVDVDVREFANHYKNHFKDTDVRKTDIRVSNIIRSLLMQDATRAKWEELNVDLRYPDGHFVLSWDGKDVTEIREALEYETFGNATFDHSIVVDSLLREVFNCGTRGR